ncbi:MAG: hypothetical protein ACTSU5_17750 [Promethearchaeota archaeon]
MESTGNLAGPWSFGACLVALTWLGLLLVRGRLAKTQSDNSG